MNFQLLSQYAPLLKAIQIDNPHLVIEDFEPYRDYYLSIPFKGGVDRKFNDQWECFDDEHVRSVLEKGKEDVWFIKDGHMSHDFILVINSKQELINLLPNIEKHWELYAFNLEFFNLNHKQQMRFEKNIPNYLRYNFW